MIVYNLRLDMVVGVELETRGGVLGAGRDDGPVEHLVEIGRHQVAVKTEGAHRVPSPRLPVSQSPRGADQTDQREREREPGVWRLASAMNAAVPPDRKAAEFGQRRVAVCRLQRERNGTGRNTQFHC